MIPLFLHYVQIGDVASSTPIFEELISCSQHLSNIFEIADHFLNRYFLLCNNRKEETNYYFQKQAAVVWKGNFANSGLHFTLKVIQQPRNDQSIIKDTQRKQR